MRALNQDGASIVEVLLILVIFGIIGFSGWFVWHARQSADQSLTQAQSTSKQTVKATKNPDTTAQKIKDSDTASRFVTDMYRTYVTKLNSDKNRNVSIAIDAIKDKLSDELRVDLISKSGSQDPVLCAPDIIEPNNIAVVSVIPTSTVIGADVDTGVGYNQAIVRADYNIQARKVVAITCL